MSMSMRWSLLGSFFDVQNLAAVVDAAFGAGAVGLLLFVAIRAFAQGRLDEKIMGAAVGGSARGVAPFRIGHGKIPFVSSGIAGAPAQEIRAGPECGAAKCLSACKRLIFQDLI
jgi:hypothetical protein